METHNIPTLYLITNPVVRMKVFPERDGNTNVTTSRSDVEKIVRMKVFPERDGNYNCSAKAAVFLSICPNEGLP